MSKGAEATARWRQRRRKVGIDQLNMVLPQPFHAPFRELATMIYDHLPDIEADGPAEWFLCYRDARGRIRHWRS